MVYERYIKRDGKVYGPYEYHNRKEGGKVISQYVGKGSVTKKSHRNFFLGIFFLGVLLAMFFILDFDLTGKATFQTDGFYSFEKTLKGDMKLYLEGKEFIPASTKVIIDNAGFVYEYPLSELVSDEMLEGDFYIRGKPISGRGEGYGFGGGEFPIVYFTLSIFSQATEKVEDKLEDDEDDEDKEKKEKKSKKSGGGGVDISDLEGANKVTICHVASGNTMEVSQSALQAHLDHGDYLGECEEEEEEEISSCDDYCVGEGYDSGVCRQNKQACDDNGEERENGGNKYCTGGDGTCCCAGDGGITGDVVGDDEDGEKDKKEEKGKVTGKVIGGRMDGSVFSSMMTGNAVLEEEVKGEVSYDEPFVYELGEGQKARIKSSSGRITLKVRDNKATVTTDYLGKQEKELLIDWGKLNIPAVEGDLLIKLVYEGVGLVSVKEKIIVEEIEEELIVNETMIINGTVVELSINTTQYGAVLNQPVKWKKNVKLNKSGFARVEIPKQASNITVYRIYDEVGTEEVQEDEQGFVSGLGKKIFSRGEEKEEKEERRARKKIDDDKIEVRPTISGNIYAELNVQGREKSIIFDFFRRIFKTMTGRVIEITETEDEKEVVINENVSEVDIEYETPAPVAFESPLGDDSGEPKNVKGKKIVISSELHYENVLSYTELNDVERSKIRLYGYENGSRVLVNFQAYDVNNNSLIDYVSWVVPHLSNQTYEIEIVEFNETHFDIADHNKTMFNSSISAVTLTSNDTEQELPSSSDGWVDMTGNVLLMHFNNDSNFGENDTHVYDFSGNGNNGTVTGANVTTSGKFGGGFEFDGVDDSVDVGGDTSLRFDAGTLDFTLTAWVKRGASGAHHYIIAKEDGDNDGWRLFYRNTNVLECSVDSIDIQSSLTITDTNWHHVVCTIDRDGNGQVYIDGTADGSAVAINSEVMATTGDVRIGQQYTGNLDFNGSIDEVAIWNRSLSTDEIRDIYLRQKGNFIDRGVYTSDVLDSEGAEFGGVWENISWDSNMGEMPADQYDQKANGIESGANMTGNVLLMHFNNDSNYGENSTFVYDFSGYGNNGTVPGGNATWTSSGKLGGGAYEFDGVDDYVDVDNNPYTIGGAVTKGLTFASWIKADNLDNDDNAIYNILGGTISYGNTHYAAGGIQILDGAVWNAPQFVIYDGSYKFAVAAQAFGVTQGEWSFVVGVLDAGGGTGRIYVNGVEAATVATTSGGIIYEPDLFTVGRETSASNKVFNGSIDEVAIWNRSLSAGEVRDIYLRGAMELNLSVRSCNDDACDGESWTSYNTTSDGIEELSVSDNRYFQYKFDFANRINNSVWNNYNLTGNYTPELFNVTLRGNYTLEYPDISFVSPTPDNASVISNTWFEVNVSITNAADLDEIIYNWNGTNYTMMNDSLVLMMNFDNVSALGENDTYVVDVSGNGNNGTTKGVGEPVVNTTDCKFGNCFTFDGVDDLVTIPYSHPALNFSGNDEITISAWINPYNAQNTASSWIIYQGTEIVLDFQTGSDYVEFILNGFSSNDRTNSGASSITTESWNHIVGMYNGTNLCVFVNGVQKSCVSPSGTYGGDVSNFIMGDYVGNDYNGSIDEVRIWNRSLSATEVYQQYVSNLNKYDTDKWEFYINQSKNATAGLDDGVYTYQSFVKDTSDNWNQTEQRTVTIVGDSFVSVWDTTQTGTSNSTSITLPLEATGDYNFTVDWGDSNSDVITAYDQAEVTHTYASEGNYTVTINGTISGFRFANGGDKLKIIDIIQWGDLNLGDSGSYFYGATNLQITATDVLDMAGTTDMQRAFQSTTSLTTVPSMNDWDMSGVTTMYLMFTGATNFNQNISDWDVSSVTNMQRMFENADSFNQDLPDWDTSSVTIMQEMFNSANVFNGSLANWNTSKVTNMYGMFKGGADAFNNNISNWDTSSVTTMERMFDVADSFDWDISNWNTSKVTSMSYMFQNTPFNQNISSWDTSNVEGMVQMFRLAASFNQDIDSWDVSSVQQFDSMFENADSFNQNLSSWNTSSALDMNSMFFYTDVFNGNISEWDISQVTDTSFMFSSAIAFNQDIGDWDVSSVETMSGMFNNAELFNQNISNWNVSKVGTIDSMFANTDTFNQDISNWDISSVASLRRAFQNTDVFNQNLSDWNTSSVTNMYQTFSGAVSFNGNISEWDTSQVTDMNLLFNGVINFNQDISGWNVSKVTDMSSMFNGATAFNQDISGWDTSSVETMDSMFNNADTFNQDISGWDTSNVITLRRLFYSSDVFNKDISSWDTSSVTTMYETFNGAVAFDQDIGDWNVSGVTTMERMFNGVTLSTTNYDAILNGWAGLTPNLQSSVLFHGGNSKYSLAGNESRFVLTNTHSWTITDGGIGNAPPSISGLVINATSVNNVTTDDLKCYATILDLDTDLINVTVEWYKEDTLNFTLDYNNSYSNGTFFNATLDSANTTVGDNWSCSLRPYDGADYGNWVNSSKLEVLVTPDTIAPTITINLPANDSVTNTDVEINASSTDTQNVSLFVDYGLVSWWRMDDYNATHVLDYVGSNDGEIKDGAIYTTSGAMGGAFEFDGDNDYVNAGNDESLNMSGKNVTVSAWIKASVVGSWDVIVAKYDLYGSGGGYRIRLGSGGVFSFSVDNGTDSMSATSASAPVVGVWYHVVGTYSGASVDLYIDGNLNKTEAWSGGITETSNSLKFGRRSGTAADFFNGTIDDVMIYNRSLSAEEINSLYANQSTKYLDSVLSLAEGTYNLTYYSQDVAGNIGSSLAQNVEVDTTAPTWQDNKTNITSSTASGEAVYFNITLNDTNADEYIFSWYNGTDWVNDSTALYIDGEEIETIKIVNIDEGNINWTWHFNDTAGNSNQTLVWNMVLEGGDTTAPNVSIVSPIAQNYSIQSITFNVTATDDTGISACLYSLDTGGSNVTMGNSSASSFNATNSSMVQGSHTVNFYCNDTSGNWNDTESVTFFIDSVVPNVALSKNDSQVEYGVETINVNWSATDDNLDSTIFNITYPNSSLIYSSSESSGEINLTTTNLTSLGVYNINLWANDTSGNVNSTTDSFSVNDTTNPLIEFVSPTSDDGTITTNTSVEINVSIVESDLDEVIYNWNGTNFTMMNDSLVLMLNFDNVSALGENDTHVVDVSGTGNDGTAYNGTAVNTTDCKFGNCFTFDGVDDYVEVADSNSLNFSSAMAIEAWVRFNGISGYMCIADKRERNGKEEAFWFGKVDEILGNKIYFGLVEGGTGAEKWATGTTSVVTDNWYHVAGTFDGSAIKIYLNGILEDSTNHNAIIYDSAYDLRIGAAHDSDGGAPGAYLNGTIDEVRIWNRSLSEDEIYQQYVSNLNKYDTDKWLLYVNQSKNATDGLDVGDYTYLAYAQDNAGNLNQTNEKTISIINPLIRNISLNSGWNLVSFGVGNDESATDKNISISPGWNLMGYSTNATTPISNLTFTNSSGTIFNWSNGTTSEKFQPYLVYFDSSAAQRTNRKFKYVAESSFNLDTTNLTSGKGYWLYSNEAGNLTMPSVGGSPKDTTFRWQDLRVSNGSDEVNISYAETLGWMEQELYYREGNQWKIIDQLGLDGKTTISSWEGIFLKSNQDNLTIIARV